MPLSVFSFFKQRFDQHVERAKKRQEEQDEELRKQKQANQLRNSSFNKGIR